MQANSERTLSLGIQTNIKMPPLPHYKTDPLKSYNTGVLWLLNTPMCFRKVFYAYFNSDVSKGHIPTTCCNKAQHHKHQQQQYQHLLPPFKPQNFQTPMPTSHTRKYKTSPPHIQEAVARRLNVSQNTL